MRGKDVGSLLLVALMIVTAVLFLNPLSSSSLSTHQESKVRRKPSLEGKNARSQQRRNAAAVYRRRREAQRSSNATDESFQMIEEAVKSSGNTQLISLLRRAMPSCGQVEDNFVLDFNQIPRHLNFSVADEAMRYAEEMKQGGASHAYDQQCTAITDFLVSVARGERVCSMHLLPPRDICQILDRYSLVFWLGNSLTRHTMNALLMLLTEDLQEGAIPPQDYEATRYPYYNCHCDGQFSEANECRDYRIMQLPCAIMAQCKKYLPSSSFIFLDTIQNLDLIKRLPVNDHRPISVLTTGRQDALDYADASSQMQRKTAEQSVQKLIDQKVSIIREASNSSRQSNSTNRMIHGIIAGEGVQDRSRDKQYPHQRRESVLNLNHHIQKIIGDNVMYRDFTFLDFFNLTLTPPAATSDGVHYLAATNIGKANSILQLMSLLVRSRDIRHSAP